MPDKFGFTCPDGHKFDAIAKLRARCPQCGKMARRNFSAPAQQSSQSESPTPPTSSPSFSKAVSRKDTASGSKPGSTSAKVSAPSSPTGKGDIKSSAESKTQSIKKPTVVRQGLPQVPRTVKKPPTPTKTTTAAKKTSSPVRNVTARKGHTPSVTKPPSGSREHKVIEQTTEEPYWRKVQRQFGFNR